MDVVVAKSFLSMLSDASMIDMANLVDGRSSYRDQNGKLGRLVDTRGRQ